MLVVPVSGVAWLLTGPTGAISALIGLGFVALLFGASALLLVWSVGRSAGSALGILLGGLFARLVLYAAALAGLSQLSWVHRPSLALATAAAFVVTLAYELVTLARSPQLFWIDADAGRPDAVGHATRS
jgi:hypothetical protein